MATYHYTLPWTVLDVGNNSLVLNRSDGILLDDQGNEHPVTTPAGVPANVSTGPSGVTAPFHAQIPYGRVRFGGHQLMPKGTRHQHQARLRQFDDPVAAWMDDF